jgi:hypothetical protein
MPHCRGADRGASVLRIHLNDRLELLQIRPSLIHRRSVIGRAADALVYNDETTDGIGSRISRQPRLPTSFATFRWAKPMTYRGRPRTGGPSPRNSSVGRRRCRQVQHRRSPHLAFDYDTLRQTSESAVSPPYEEISRRRFVRCTCSGSFPAQAGRRKANIPFHQGPVLAVLKNRPELRSLSEASKLRRMVRETGDPRIEGQTEIVCNLHSSRFIGFAFSQYGVDALVPKRSADFHETAKIFPCLWEDQCPNSSVKARQTRPREADYRVHRRPARDDKKLDSTL